MSIVSVIKRETVFVLREKNIIVWAFTVLLLSCLAVGFGIDDVNQQRSSIARLIESDALDRESELAKVKSWGSAGYYSFHFTYSEPSDFAFAAMGSRDQLPWKHRLRMLALEGQIYEQDTDNPVVALIGRFDFAFLSAFIIPIVLILALYNLRSGEKSAGRYNLLQASSYQKHSLWVARTFIKTLIIYLFLITPLIVGSLISGTALTTLTLACGLVFAHTIVWALVCYWATSWQKSGTSILMTLLSIWLVFSLILPSSARLGIDKVVPVPDGSDILMTQREAVNDAWDLPRETTMNAFFERFPGWSDYTKIDSSFEWQWYYAFQQVGDLHTESLTRAYRNGRIKRDKFAGLLSIFMPPSFLERRLQGLAQTDFSAMLAYEDKARRFHTELKDFYYPKLFNNEPFSEKELNNLPDFVQKNK